jgi:ankyrin repeat protein
MRTQIKIINFFFFLGLGTIASATDKGSFIDRAAVGALGGVILVLGWAALKGLEKVWTIFFKAPSDLPLNIAAEGATDLMRAAIGGDISSAAILTDSGNCDVNAVDAQGATALMFAAEKGLVDMVNLLLEKRADKGLKSASGFSAFQYADAYESDRHSRTAIMLKKWKVVSQDVQ